MHTINNTDNVHRVSSLRGWNHSVVPGTFEVHRDVYVFIAQDPKSPEKRERVSIRIDSVSSVSEAID